MAKKFSLKKENGKWWLWLDPGRAISGLLIYNTWEEAMQKINEILTTWEET